MITKILTLIFRTDSLPILGGASAAISQTVKILNYFPTWELVCSTIIIAFLGAIVGYLAKVLIDYTVKSIKSIKHKSNV